MLRLEHNWASNAGHLTHRLYPSDGSPYTLKPSHSLLRAGTILWVRKKSTFQIESVIMTGDVTRWVLITVLLVGCVHALHFIYKSFCSVSFTAFQKWTVQIKYIYNDNQQNRLPLDWANYGEGNKTYGVTIFPDKCKQWWLILMFYDTALHNMIS